MATPEEQLIEDLIDDLVAGGMPRAEAERQALETLQQLRGEDAFDPQSVFGGSIPFDAPVFTGNRNFVRHFTTRSSTRPQFTGPVGPQFGSSQPDASFRSTDPRLDSDPDIDLSDPNLLQGREFEQQASLDDLFAPNRLDPNASNLEVVEGERLAPEGTDEDSIVRTEREESTVGDLLEEFWALDDKDLIKLQERLFAGGFYGPEAEAEDIAWGTHDEPSFQAWSLVVQRAARFNAAGRDITTDDVMALAAQASNLSDDGLDEPKVVISLTDPSAIVRMVNNASRRLTGRKATPERQRELVAMIHELQREVAIEQSRAIEAESGTFTLQQPDVEARIEQEIRRTSPNEVEGFAVGQALQTLENLIGQL